MLRSLSLRLLGIVSLAAQVCIAGGDDDTTNCPVLKGGTSLPTGVKASSCQNGKSRKFTTSVGTFATLYQSEETWQQRPEKANFTWLIREATERGLHLVADHLGGEPERLLNMHITIVDYDEPYKGFNPDADAWLETFDAGNDTQASNCHILLPFPKQNDTGDAGEWRRIQKNLVSMMYHCVQHYHHPDIDRSNPPWWYRGTARFFDGLLWPATPDMWADRRWGPNWSVYPELYDRPNADVFYHHDGSGALFWHAAHLNAGWQPWEVTRWIKSRSSADGGWGPPDPELKPVFHSFGRALTRGAIRYSETSPVNTSAVGWDKETRLARRPTPVALYEDDGWFRSFQVRPWDVKTIEIVLEDIGTGNDTFHGWSVSVEPDRFDLAHPLDDSFAADDCEYAFREVGKDNWSLNQRRFGDPPDSGVQWRGTGPGRFEFLFTCTGRRGKTVPFQLKLSRWY